MSSFEAELAALIADWLGKGMDPKAMLLGLDDGKGLVRDHMKLADALKGGRPEADEAS